jgi:MtN3 and saliva related transmembrane protein
MDWIEILGYAAGTLTTLAFLPQFIKLAKSKSARDISAPTYAALSIGIVMWLVYGILRGAWPVIAANGVAFILITASFVLIVKYKRPGQPPQQ